MAEDEPEHPFRTKRRSKLKVRIMVKDLAKRVGIDNPYQLQKILDVSYPTAARLFDGSSEAVYMETVSLLCEVLNCEPGDLFIRTPRTESTPASPEESAS